jgi:hypothetical protein
MSSAEIIALAERVENRMVFYAQLSLNADDKISRRKEDMEIAADCAVVSQALRAIAAYRGDA